MSQIFFSHLDTAGQQQWILDAGCGSAEKSAELAVRYPQPQVVSIDQSTAIRQTAAHFGDVANLHFVQGDVLRPPLLAGVFDQVVNIGVLHHTRSTQAAFDKVADLAEPEGRLFVWLYPREGEDSFLDGLYRQRDRHFAGLGSKLPSPLVMVWCRLYVKMFSNQIKDFLVREHKRNCQIFPPEIYPVFHNRAEMTRSAMFLSFDNVMPRYRFRRGSQEVIGWYETKGFGAPNIMTVMKQNRFWFRGEGVGAVVECSTGDVWGGCAEGFFGGLALDGGGVVLGRVPDVLGRVVVGRVRRRMDRCDALQQPAGLVEVGQGSGVVGAGVVEDDRDLLGAGFSLEQVRCEDCLPDVPVPPVGYGVTFLPVSESAPGKDWDVLRRSTDRSGALPFRGPHAAGPGLVLQAAWPGWSRVPASGRGRVPPRPGSPHARPGCGRARTAADGSA